MQEIQSILSKVCKTKEEKEIFIRWYTKNKNKLKQDNSDDHYIINSFAKHLMSLNKNNTINSQIKTLQSKGLIIDDMLFAEEKLIRDSYYFINSYSKPFLSENKRFILGTTFSELYSLFAFDRQMRSIVLQSLLIVENNIKSIFSYQMAKSSDNLKKGFLSPSNFDSNPKKTKQLKDLLGKMRKQIRDNGSKHILINNTRSCDNQYSVWATFKILSFGLTCDLYTVLKHEDQIEIASILNIEVDKLATYLPILANYRNLCAHEDILFGTRIKKHIEPTKYHQILDVPQVDGEYKYGNNDLLSLMIILKQLLLTDDFNLFIKKIGKEINTLENKIKVIDKEQILDSLGLPENFKDISNNNDLKISKKI